MKPLLTLAAMAALVVVLEAHRLGKLRPAVDRVRAFARRRRGGSCGD